MFIVRIRKRRSGLNQLVDNKYLLKMQLPNDHNIKYLTVEELKSGKEIIPTCHNYLGKRKEFDLDKDVIIDFCKFAVKFF